MPALRLLLRRLLWLAALAGGLAPALSHAQSAADLDAQIAAARDLMGTDIGRARTQLAQVRALAVHAQQLETRLAADEIECRILSDSDAVGAERIAAAGVAAARQFAPGAISNALLRLRACWIGVQMDTGKIKFDDPALTEIIDSANGRELAPARAIALVERGLHRSRHGALLEGQADLLQACGALSRLRLAQDEELCLAHLANHYKRMGDFTEALRLLRRLEDAAEARGARVDRAIYVYDRALVQAAMQDWHDALGGFELAAQLSDELNDEPGRAYALNGMGDALMHLDRPREAQPYAEQALQRLEKLNDPVQVINAKLLLVRTLHANKGDARALDVLAGVKDAIARQGTEYQQAEWLELDAEAQAGLGRWQRAYEALAQWRTLTARRHVQQLSENAARLRMQFNRERDAAELRAMQQLNNQTAELRNTQTAVVVLAIALALAMLLFAARKVRQSRRLQVLASTDELTGAFNRRAVMAFAEQALKRAAEDRAPLSLLLIDVDHFKRINDQHGHPEGDRVLHELVRTLQAGMRASDRLGRIGGEEFMVVLPHTRADDAVPIAERMRVQCAQLALITAGGEALPFSISAGIACSNGRAITLSALVSEADSALYAAKSGGRNAVSRFTPVPMQPQPAA